MIVFLFSISIKSNDNYLLVTKPEIDSSERQYIESIIEKIKYNPKYENLTNLFLKYCRNLNEVKRKSLAIHVMVNELEKDERGIDLSYFQNEDEFLQSLSTSDFRTYTIYFTNIDAICYQATQEYQSQDNLKKVTNLFSAINFSTEYLNSLQSLMKTENKKIKEDLNQIQNQITEEAEKIHQMLYSLQNAYQNLTELNKKASSYIENFKNSKLYLKVMIFSFLISFIIPNIFIPILCVTFLMIIIEAHFGIKNNFQMKYLRAFYLALCSTIVISSLWLRILLIKQRIFGIVEKSKNSKIIPRMFS